MTAPPNLAARLPAAAEHLLRQVGEAAAERDAEAYLVGGVVRDLLRGRPNLDWDIVVEPDAIALAAELGRRIGGQLRAYRRFGTATLTLPDGTALDFATARTERYDRPGALASVEYARFELDLARRDFSINAMALALDAARFGALVDPLGGRADMEAKIVRVLHDASFRDDPTRLLRAVRYERRLGFRMEPQTEALALAAVSAGALDTVTAERLRAELVRLAEEADWSGLVARLEQIGFWAWVAPGLALDRPLVAQVRAALDWWRDHDLEPLGLSLLLLMGVLGPLGAGDAARVAAERFRATPAEQRAMRDGIGLAEALPPEWDQSPSPSAVRRRLDPVPPEGLLFLRAAFIGPDRDRLERFLLEWRGVRLAITGDDLQAEGWPPGPALGAALRATLDARVDGCIMERQQELEYARAWLARADRAG